MTKKVTLSFLKPEQTAMHRSKPSPFAQALVKKILPSQTILDYGCGYGEDVNFYHKNDIEAFAYDPYKPFGWSKKPTALFDIVTVIYVLNVLPTSSERQEVLKEASKYLSSNGRMIVVTRTPKEINAAGLKNNWEKHNDGFWSERNHATFQHGLSEEEIVSLAEKLNLNIVPKSDYLLKRASTYTLVELQKN